MHTFLDLIFSKCKLPYNVACLDVTPLNSNEERSSLCAVGLWTQISVWIYRLPTLDVLHKESLSSGFYQESRITIKIDTSMFQTHFLDLL